jgi:hypothetical protein
MRNGRIRLAEFDPYKDEHKKDQQNALFYEFHLTGVFRRSRPLLRG